MEAFWRELASPLGGHHSKSLKEDKLTRGLSHSIPIPSELTAKKKSLLLTYHDKSCLVLSGPVQVLVEMD